MSDRVHSASGTSYQEEEQFLVMYRYNSRQEQVREHFASGTSFQVEVMHIYDLRQE